MAEIVVRAFAPWRRARPEENDPAKDLATLLQHASEVGIFLFSQGWELVFVWPAREEVSPEKVALHPALVTVTNRFGQRWGEAGVVMPAKYEKCRYV